MERLTMKRKKYINTPAKTVANVRRMIQRQADALNNKEYCENFTDEAFRRIKDNLNKNVEDYYERSLLMDEAIAALEAEEENTLRMRRGRL